MESKSFLMGILKPRIIISEFFSPNKKKTVAPAKLGGVAGGTKFTVEVGLE
jgi:hypothetical protein